MTAQINAAGIYSWTALIAFVQKLPYGRTSSRKDLNLVLAERKGTCSSKHAFLKKVADLNDIGGISLVIGIYKMNEVNTPGIGSELSKNGLDFIPEAHCYLKINGNQTDLTSEFAEFEKIKLDLLLEQEIQPQQVAEYKVLFHQNYLKDWLETANLSFDFEQLWQIRERCIQNLAGQ